MRSRGAPREIPVHVAVRSSQARLAAEDLDDPEEAEVGTLVRRRASRARVVSSSRPGPATFRPASRLKSQRSRATRVPPAEMTGAFAAGVA